MNWSPLAWGFLTGKYERGDAGHEDSTAAEDSRFAERYLTDECFDALDVLREVAEDVGATPAQVVLAWQLQHPDITTPIVGASTVEQLEENLAAADVSLSENHFERLSAVKTPDME